MLKKIIPAVALVASLVGGYFGFSVYEAHRFLDAVTPQIKNTSLRVSNAARFEAEENSKMTYKELFERVDGDVGEIEKRLLEVQTISTADTKDRTEPIVDYMNASQEFLRALSSKYRKQLALSSTMDLAKRRSADFWDEPGWNSYALKALTKASEDEKKALGEYQEAVYDVADALGRLHDAKTKLASLAGQDALLSDRLIAELQKKNPTREQDEKQKAVDRQRKLAERASLTAEGLAKQSDCLACHAIERKVVGPAYKTVSKKYAGQPGAAEKLAAKIVSGGSGVWGVVPMPPNNVTKEEASKLATWILGLNDSLGK